MWASPPLTRGRQATARAGKRASSTKLPAGSQLLIKSPWNPGQLTSARRVAARDQLPRGDTPQGNQVARTGEVIRCNPPPQPGESALAKHLVT